MIGIVSKNRIVNFRIVQTDESTSLPNLVVKSAFNEVQPALRQKTALFRRHCGMVINQTMCSLEKHHILWLEVMQLAVWIKQLLLHLVVVGLIEFDVEAHVDGYAAHSNGKQLRGGVAQQCYLYPRQVVVILLDEPFELFQVEHCVVLTGKITIKKCTYRDFRPKM